MSKGKIMLSSREKEILAFFETNNAGIIEDVAIHFTGESRQNLYNPGFFRFKQLGVLQETEATKETTNKGVAKIYVRGRNFGRVEVLTSEINKAVQFVAKAHRQSIASQNKKNMTYKVPKDVAAAVIKGKITRNALNGAIHYHRKKNPAYAEILIGGRQLLK